MGLNVSYDRDGSIHVSQPPGGPNVLGRLRFNFPNRFLVYQHDTNEKFMFAHEVRAYSHGCMRIQDPAKYADVLLNIARPTEHWTVERVTQMFGGGEQDIALQPAQIWVHLTYQSAFVDDNGKLQVRRDLYNLDSRTLAAIKTERVIIEPAPRARASRRSLPHPAAASPRRHAPCRSSNPFSSAGRPRSDRRRHDKLAAIITDDPSQARPGHPWLVAEQESGCPGTSPGMTAHSLPRSGATSGASLAACTVASSALGGPLISSRSR